MTQPLTETEIVQLRGIGDRLDIDEVREVYLPLSRLLSLYAKSTKRLGEATSAFLQEEDTTTPFVVAAMAVSHYIETQTGWSIKKFVRTARRYRTVQIKAGRQLLTAADPLPDELRVALAKISAPT